MTHRLLLTFFLSAIFSVAVFSQPGKNSAVPPGVSAIREAGLKKDLYEMAGDHFRGREAGTLDELKVSMWLASPIQSRDLRPHDAWCKGARSGELQPGQAFTWHRTHGALPTHYGGSNDRKTRCDLTAR